MAKGHTDEYKEKRGAHVERRHTHLKSLSKTADEFGISKSSTQRIISNRRKTPATDDDESCKT